MELTRDSLLKKEDLQIEKVPLGKDEYVFVRQMTGRERDRFDQSLMQEKTDDTGKVIFARNLVDFRAKLAACTLCNAKGDLLLGIEDVPTLSQNMSAARLEKIMTTAQEMNKISDTDKENLIKNSKDTPAKDSNSDSV